MSTILTLTHYSRTLKNDRNNSVQARPYSAYKADDTQGYMSHHRLKQQIEKQKQTLDPGYNSRANKVKKNTQNDEAWERFNEQLSHKSGYSRRSNRSQNSRMSQRVRSAAGLKRRERPDGKDRGYGLHSFI